MYFCSRCESVFRDEDELAYHYERGEFWGSPYSVKEYECPKCNGSISYIEDNNYHTCDYCKKVCVYDYIKTADGDYYCEACYEVKNIDD